MIRITVALVCDGCGAEYCVQELGSVRLEHAIAAMTRDSRHKSLPAKDRWTEYLPTVPSSRGDYCPRCQAIAGRPSLDADPIAVRQSLEHKPRE